jgi:GNAT superfamily N-acetyltransferase
MAEITFRKAEWKDLDLILEGIIASEKSGTTILSYCTLFDLNIEEFRTILISIFKEQVENQPWCLTHWLIGELGKDAVCCLTVWKENSSFQASDLLRIQLLSHFIPVKFKMAKERLVQVAKVSIKRKPEYIQIEHLYTLEKHQGNGFMKTFLIYICLLFPRQKLEIQVMANNIKALNLYESVGFQVTEKKCWDGLYELNLLPSNCKISLTKYL